MMNLQLVLSDDTYQILLDYQTNHGYPSKDKALAELLKEFKRIGGK